MLVQRQDFHKVYGSYPDILSLDKGMDSEKNNKFCIEKGIGAYIQARDFGNKGSIGFIPNPHFQFISCDFSTLSL